MKLGRLNGFHCAPEAMIREKLKTPACELLISQAVSKKVFTSPTSAGKREREREREKEANGSRQLVLV